MSALILLNKITSEHKSLVGEKAMSLSNLLQAGLPVPNAFVITTKAWQTFLNHQHLSDKIKQELTLLDPQDPLTIQHTSQSIQNHILSTPFPNPLATRIFNTYEALDSRTKNSEVSLRPSLTSKSYFGTDHPLFLNIKGEATIIEIVKEIWSHLYSPQCLQNTNKLNTQEVAIIVQKMIPAKVSGFLHTHAKAGKDKDHYQIESIWGLGEYLVQHFVKADNYLIDKKTLDISKKIVNPQHIYLTKDNNKTVEKKVHHKRQSIAKLTDEQIQHLVKYISQLRKIQLIPQTIEWVFDGKSFYFLQSEDLIVEQITPSEKKLDFIDEHHFQPLEMPVVAQGQASSPGLVSGFVKHIYHPDDIENTSSEDIIIINQLTPEYHSIIMKCCGLISHHDGITSNATILAREVGIPSVVAIDSTLKNLKDGQIITIDGTHGLVYFGRPDLRSKSLTYSRDEQIKYQQQHQQSIQQAKEKLKVKTITKIYATLPAAQNSQFLKLDTSDGVMQIKGELVLSELGLHPKEHFKKKGKKTLIAKLKSKLSKVLKTVPNKDVFYHLSDIQSHFARKLLDGHLHEPTELNPILGYRGTYRHLFHRELLQAELDAIIQLRTKHKNIHLVLPLVRHSTELKQLLKILKQNKLNPSSRFKIYLNLSTPSNLILLPEYQKIGINGFIIDLDELTKLMLGVDPTNVEVSQLFQPTDASIIWLIEFAARYCRRQSMPIVLLGTQTGLHPHLAESLIPAGITGFAVPPDLVHAARRFAARAEKKMISK